MQWHWLKKSHYYKEPVEYVCASTIFPEKQYDILYENQNNLSHKVWQDFDQQYKTGFEFKEDLSQIDFNKEIIALWFFRERSDQNRQPILNVGGAKIKYHQNKFLLTACKDISIQESKKKYIRRPLVQLDISKQQFNSIVEKLK